MWLVCGDLCECCGEGFVPGVCRAGMQSRSAQTERETTRLACTSQTPSTATSPAESRESAANTQRTNALSAPRIQFECLKRCDAVNWRSSQSSITSASLSVSLVSPQQGCLFMKNSQRSSAGMKLRSRNKRDVWEERRLRAEL